jgi:hypothetical protein
MSLVLGTAGVFGGMLLFQASTIRPSTPSQAAFAATNVLLTATQAHPNGPLPKDDPALPSYVWVSEECWTLLQQAMITNAYTYTLALLSTYNPDSNPYWQRDVSEVFVRVDFRHGQDAQVQYYEGGLADCQAMK